MASPQTPYPPPPEGYGYRYRRFRRRSVFGPIVLIAIGVCFLLANMHVISGARLGWWFATYWPVLLILLGLVRIIEYTVARSQGSAAPRFGGGAVFLLILIVVIGIGLSSARRVNWNAFGDNADVNPGFDSLFGQSYEFTQTLTQPLPAGGSLAVDSDHGAVTVHATDNPSDPVKLVLHRRVSADRQEDANKLNDQHAPKMTVDGNVLHITSGEPQANVGFVWGAHMTSDLEIWAPKAAALQISATHGDINVSQRNADVKVSTTHGDTQISQVNGNVEATGQHGDMNINQIKGDVNINGRADDVTVSDITGYVKLNGEFFGDTKLSRTGKVEFVSSRTEIQLAKLTGDLDMDSGDLRITSGVGPFVVHTNAKDMHIEGITGSVNIDNSHGEIEVHPQSPYGDVTINNHQGAINVVVPENAGYTVNARSTRGDFDSDFQFKVSEEGDNHIAEGKLGNGSNRLDLTTDHGTIEIRKG
ncbi:MAG TPA: DUF4097 family beta strand repeat-containing protein [Terriglobales bacterium]|nr:DUF4097 family beta strand repeat-containing protein [Terriglobales bacterium]